MFMEGVEESTKLEESLFSPAWTAKDELRLLDSIDEHGYGNWSSVATQLGRSAEECKAHYDRHYIDEPHASLPILHPAFEATPIFPPPTNDPVRPYYAGTEINGYLPHRGEFVAELDNNAEQELVELDFENDDDPLFKALKLHAVQIYWWRLKRRVYRKRIIRDYGLIDIRRQLVSEGLRLTKRQRRLKSLLRPFMRLMSPEDAEKMLQACYYEDELCNQVKKLQQYREDGITTLQGGQLYEKLLTQKKQSKEEQVELFKKQCTSEELYFYQLASQNNSGNEKYNSKKNGYRKEPPRLDITYAYGVEKLTPEEKELCSLCRFTPVAYLQYRQQLIAESRKLGKLRLADARKVLKIDVNKTRKLYNLLLSKGEIFQ